jgi:FkbM family methyltransferase
MSRLWNFGALAATVLKRPFLLVGAVRRRGLGPILRDSVRAARSGFVQEREYASIAAMPATAPGVMKACSSFVADATDEDDATLLVRLKTGERFLIRRSAAGKDMWLLRQTFVQTSWLSGYDVRDRLVLNVGANIGDTAVYFGKRGARILAWEPSPQLAALARRNCALNAVKAEIYGRGIGDRRAVLTLASSGGVTDSASATIFPERTTNERTRYAGARLERIEVVPFSEVLDSVQDVYLAQINCEGCEYPALGSVNDQQLRRVAHYAVDCHAGPASIARRFAKAGYAVRTEGAMVFADRID